MLNVEVRNYKNQSMFWSTQIQSSHLIWGKVLNIPEHWFPSRLKEDYSTCTEYLISQVLVLIE